MQYSIIYIFFNLVIYKRDQIIIIETISNNCSRSVCLFVYDYSRTTYSQPVTNLTSPDRGQCCVYCTARGQPAPARPRPAPMRNYGTRPDTVRYAVLFRL